MYKRPVQVVVISDVHLGTYGCRATELVNYLRSIQPSLLVLNGDIIDGWQFSKRYFPQSHMQVIKEIFKLLSTGTRVVYITGNHDEMLRRYSDLTIGQFTLTDKMVMELNGKMTWIFHGDVFDRTTKGSAKAIAKLGGWGYDLLILINSLVNKILALTGHEKLSFSKVVKNSVKKAVKWIGNFEQTAAELAIENNYDTVICGHIHQPQKKLVKTSNGQVEYLNSGDWIENLTALEYNEHQWSIYTYNPANFVSVTRHIDTKLPELNVLTDEVAMFISSLGTAGQM
jgi:UDP-2,3-diacylglucosamine pyrophosphatase LpxH